MSADWLDVVLKPRALPDDGFAERVLAVAQAQRRTKLLLRALVTVLVLGALAAYVAGVVLTAAERWDGGAAILKDGQWLDGQRSDFRAVLAELDQRPALQRRTGRDAAAALDVVERELLDANSARARACAGELKGDKNIDPIASACDTSFLTGLTAFDEWRRATVMHSAYSAVLAPPRYSEIVRTHLRRAATVDDGGQAFRAAAEDSIALGRLLLGHSFWGAVVLRVVADETERAGARAGGFVAPLSSQEASEALHVWAMASDYGSASGTDDDVAFLRAHDRSVLSCGLRSDAFTGVLAMQALYVGSAARERNDSWANDGCSPRATGAQAWMLFGDERTTGTALAAFVSRLPGVRSLMALVLTQPQSHLEIKQKRH
ncbi:MAG: hypothetical protein IT383_25870 [Deltaproteobacteria bacterium]|nr:hypothetical protein [Deltaproteobacteria bacterium]